MKGKVNIQLFDKNGKLKKEITKENMITNALDKILNPDFPPYWGRHISPKSIYDSYTPIVNRLIGGVLLFNSDRTEDVNHVIPTIEDFNSYVGSAGGPFTGQTSKVKGSLNLNETTILNDGYKFVWDFGTGKSFNLKSLSLTSLDGGNSGLDFDNVQDTSIRGSVLKNYNYVIDGTDNNGFNGANTLTNIPRINKSTCGNIIYISDDFKTIYCGKINNNTLTLTKFTYRDTIKINDNLNTNTSSSIDLNNISNWEKGKITQITPTLQFDDINLFIFDNDYIYSCKSTGSGDTMTLQLIKINVSDLSFTEKTITFTSTISLNNSFRRYFIIEGNKMFLNDMYNRTNGYIFVINLDTDTLEKTITYPHAYSMWEVMKRLNDNLMFVFELDSIHQIKIINIETGEIKHQRTRVNDGVVQYLNSFKFLDNSPVFVYMNGGSDVAVGLYTCYFASIFNLDEAINKAEDDTLKITYTITNS